MFYGEIENGEARILASPGGGGVPLGKKERQGGTKPNGQGKIIFIIQVGRPRGLPMGQPDRSSVAAIEKEDEEEDILLISEVLNEKVK